MTGVDLDRPHGKEDVPDPSRVVFSSRRIEECHHASVSPWPFKRVLSGLRNGRNRKTAASISAHLNRERLQPSLENAGKRTVLQTRCRFAIADRA